MSSKSYRKNVDRSIHIEGANQCPFHLLHNPQGIMQKKVVESFEWNDEMENILTFYNKVYPPFSKLSNMCPQFGFDDENMQGGHL